MQFAADGASTAVHIYPVPPCFPKDLSLRSSVVPSYQATAPVKDVGQCVQPPAAKPIGRGASVRLLAGLFPSHFSWRVADGRADAWCLGLDQWASIAVCSSVCKSENHEATMAQKLPGGSAWAARTYPLWPLGVVKEFVGGWCR